MAAPRLPALPFLAAVEQQKPWSVDLAESVRPRAVDEAGASARVGR